MVNTLNEKSLLPVDAIIIPLFYYEKSGNSPSHDLLSLKKMTGA
ncbi:hypothetical protein PROVRETT_05461 [Providencia rettgeri DSM 1131]|nr:hypothetical protein PROVRETT_05461 [Providencia rettgeri DSM 1131]